MAEASRCQVCAKPKTRFSYGAYTCDACKSFFYCNTEKGARIPPCTAKQQCIISSETSKKCTFCRFKKCVAVGMSRYAGQTTPRGKRQVNAADQKSQAHFFIGRMDVATLVASIKNAYEYTCPLLKEKVATVIERAQILPQFKQYSSQLFCPLNLVPVPKDKQIDHYYSIYKSIVKFAIGIPGFDFLQLEDQYTLALTGVFQVLFVSLARLFDSRDDCIYCLNGQIIRRGIIHEDSRSEHLNCMFVTAKKINNLNLSDDEMAIFCSFLMVNGDLSGLKDKDAVSSLQEKLLNILIKYVSEGLPENPNIIRDLLEIISSLTHIETAHFHRLNGETESVNNHPDCGRIAGISDASDKNSEANGSEYPHDHTLITPTLSPSLISSSGGMKHAKSANQEIVEEMNFQKRLMDIFSLFD